jgi:TRAP-type C4-dicarboxylate transport system permease small subunit
MLSLLSKLTKFLSALCLGLAALGLMATTAIIGWQVFSRFILGDSPAWSEQSALVLMVWYVTLAAAAGVREGFHIRLTACVDALPQGVRKGVEIAAHIVVLGFGVTLGLYGADLVARTWSHTLPTLNLSRGVAYLPLPLSGWLIALFSLEQVLAILKGQKVEPLWN